MTSEEEVIEVVQAEEIEPPPIVEEDNQTINHTQSDGNESNSTCTICMEEWTIGSDHRISCLKCGHLFGRSCIERWIKEKGSAAQCPTCNKPAKRADLRNLWCKTLKAADNTEVSQLQQLLEGERKLRKTDSAVIFHQNLKLDLAHNDIEKLKKGIIERDEKIAKLQAIIDRFNQLRAQKMAQINEGQNNDRHGVERDTDSVTMNVNDIDFENDDDLDAVIDIEPKELKGMFHFAQNVDIGPNAGCKGFSMCPTSCVLILAQQTPRGTRNIFGNFGLRKFSIIDTNQKEFIPLHTKPITSIHLKPVGDLILTSSLDKTVKLTSISNNTSVNTYHCTYDPVCAAWSPNREQQFYVASSNCYIGLYDIRNTSECIYQTNQRIANSGLVAMAPSTSADDLHGLLVNDSKGSQFLELSDSSQYDLENIDRSIEHLTCHSLPFEGLMGNVDFCKRLDLALITTRRSTMHPKVTHNLVKLKRAESANAADKIQCQRVRTFMGGQSGELLNYSRILKHPTLADSVLVGACDQDARGIRLWDSSDDSVYQTIKTNEWIRDMIMYNPPNSNQHILYTLSTKSVGVYRWDYA